MDEDSPHQLTRKVWELFHEIDLDDAMMYKNCKEAVLWRFKITPKSYRLKFGNLKISHMWNMGAKCKV